MFSCRSTSAAARSAVTYVRARAQEAPQGPLGGDVQDVLVPGHEVRVAGDEDEEPMPLQRPARRALRIESWGKPEGPEFTGVAAAGAMARMNAAERAQYARRVPELTELAFEQRRVCRQALHARFAAGARRGFDRGRPSAVIGRSQGTLLGARASE